MPTRPNASTFSCELVAQLVEQRPFKAWVLGSIPSELTILARIPPGNSPAPITVESCANDHNIFGGSYVP